MENIQENIVYPNSNAGACLLCVETPSIIIIIATMILLSLLLSLLLLLPPQKRHWMWAGVNIQTKWLSHFGKVVGALTYSTSPFW